MNQNENIQKLDAENPIKIAIADDHQMLRDLIVNNLNSLPDCEVILSAIDGDELLSGLETLEILPDICIIDISMPGLNGYDTQTAIRRQWPNMKTLALSLFDDRKCIIQMLQNGANGFVSKQSPLSRFHEAILAVYHHGSYLSDGAIKEMHEPNALPILTEREKEYLLLTCSQQSNEEIVQKMGVTLHTIDHYRESVYKKLKVNNKSDLLFYVKKTGIVFMK
jgi:two-component system invasion response regulator UvrY